MITSQLMLCADGIVRDAETNTISIFTLIEEVSPDALPIVIPRFAVLNILERTYDDAPTIHCILQIALEKETIFQQEFVISFQDKKRTRSIVTLGGLPISRHGLLEVSLLLGDVLLDQYQIPVFEPRQQAVQADV